MSDNKVLLNEFIFCFLIIKVDFADVPDFYLLRWCVIEDTHYAQAGTTHDQSLPLTDAFMALHVPQVD